MTGPRDEVRIASLVRTVRLIVLALLGGLMGFAAVVMVTRLQQNQPPADLPIVSLVAAGNALIVLTVRGPVLNAMARSNRHRLSAAPATSSLLALYQTQSIVGAALLEGAGMFCLAAYLIDGVPWALALAAIMWVLLAVLHWPSHDRIDAWMVAEIQSVEEARQQL